MASSWLEGGMFDGSSGAYAWIGHLLYVSAHVILWLHFSIAHRSPKTQKRMFYLVVRSWLGDGDWVLGVACSLMEVDRFDHSQLIRRF